MESPLHKLSQNETIVVETPLLFSLPRTGCLSELANPHVKLIIGPKSLRFSPGSLRNAKHFTEHEGRRFCQNSSKVTIPIPASITQVPVLSMMHSIHTFIARAVFYTYGTQGKNRTGPWKVPWAALQRA